MIARIGLMRVARSAGSAHAPTAVRVWKRKNTEQSNEPLDLRAYNVAALEGLNPDLKVSAEQLAVRAEERRKAMRLAPVGPDDDDDSPTWPPRRGGRWGTR